MEETSRRSVFGRRQSSFKKHFQLIAFRKLLGWKLEKSYTRKYTCHLGLHQRSPWNTNGKESWVQNMLSDQKLGNYLEVSNRTDQFQIQVVNENRATWKKNVPIWGDRCCFFGKNGETRCWNECNPDTFIWRQQGSQRWNCTWKNEETRCWNKHRKCAR